MFIAYLTMEILFTEHILLQYIERFNQNLNSIQDYKQRLRAAEAAVNAILTDAKYVGDDDRGVLLKNEDSKCFIIIKDRKAITIYPMSNKTKVRELRAKSQRF